PFDGPHAMSQQSVGFQDIETRVARHERRGLAVTILFVGVFVAGAAAFLGYTYLTLNSLSEQLERVRADLLTSTRNLDEVNVARVAAQQEMHGLRADLEVSNRRLTEVNAARLEAERTVQSLQAEAVRQRSAVAELTSQLEEANKKLRELTSQIHESTNYVRYLHPVDWADAKDLYNQSPKLGNLLQQILRMRNDRIRFSFANTPNIGFTSPGFAGYILQVVKDREPSSPPDAVLRTLEKTSAPVPGDLIVYETGFTMFFLQDHLRKPFVIGMTPQGIAALEPDFGVRRLHALRTGLLER